MKSVARTKSSVQLHRIGKRRVSSLVILIVVSSVAGGIGVPAPYEKSPGVKRDNLSHRGFLENAKSRFSMGQINRSATALLVAS